MSDQAENKNIIACKACGKEVAKGVKKCPHCGKKLKMGMFTKIILGVVVLVIANAILNPGKTLEERLQETRDAQAYDLSPRGELSQMFSLMGDYTDIQRDNKEKEITGQIVQWRLPVFDVNKSSEGKYRVQTSGSKGAVGAFVDIYATSPKEQQQIEALQSGDFVSFKGKIEGTFMRNIEIEDAVLVD